jgi:outer membrane biosynthesis protein TonB
LVIGQALSNASVYDYKSTLWLIDQMAEEFTQEGNKQRVGVASLPQLKAKENESGQSAATSSGTTAVTYSSDEDIQKFLSDLQTKLQEKLSLPKQAADELKKKKSKKLKTTVSVGVDNDGNVKRIEITEPSEWEKINNAVVKDINGCAPFANAPKTKEGILTFMVYLKKDQISVELP